MMELTGKFNTAKVFTDNIDSETISQVITLLNMPYMADLQVRIMPDCHAGKGCVVGTTIQLKDVVVPNLTGVDLGCGLLATKLEETAIDLEIAVDENTALFNVDLNKTATGLVKFYIISKETGENYTMYMDVKDGHVELVTDSIAAGNYTLTATYMGDSRFNTNITSADLTVNEAEKVLATEITDITIFSDLNISAKLVDEKGNAVATSTVPELTDDLTAATWRYAIAAFFLQTQYTAWPYSADFTTAGQPSAWGPAYLGEDTGAGDNGGNNSGDNGGNSQPDTYNTPAPEYLKTVVYGKSCRMDGWGDLSTKTVAIYSYDRFGVEHAAAYYEGNEVYEPKVEIFWELDGGKVDGDLPTYVTERYVLPIPVKYGYNFDCWRSVKSNRGQKLTEIPAGWKGTLYAFWKKWPTDVTNIIWNDQIQVYDIMGRFVGNELPTDQHGLFIVIQGKNKVKIVL